MQVLLPIVLRRSLLDNVVRPLVELSTFFRDLCSTNLTQEDMNRLEGNVCALCARWNKYSPLVFLLSWFIWLCTLFMSADSGAPYSIGGCIRQKGKIYVRIFINLDWYEFYNTITNSRERLMFICRSLGGFKSSVRNKAAPKGCIAEGYIATELVTFCSRYLGNTSSFHNRPQRNPDGLKGVGTRVNLNRLQLSQIHQYITLNSE